MPVVKVLPVLQNILQQESPAVQLATYSRDRFTGDMTFLHQQISKYYCETNLKD